MPSTDHASAGAGANAAHPFRLVASLLSISRTTRALMGVKLTELDLHNGQDEMLLAISGDGPKSVTAAARQLNVRPSTVSKMLDRLADRGLVVRLADDVDARRTLVQLTPAGQDLADRITALHQKVETDLVTSLAKDPSTITQALAEIDSVLSKRLRRLR